MLQPLKSVKFSTAKILGYTVQDSPMVYGDASDARGQVSSVPKYFS